MISFPTLIKKSNNDNNIVIDNTMSQRLSDEYIYLKSSIEYTGYQPIINFIDRNIKSLLTSAISKDPIALQLITDRDFLIGMFESNISLDAEYINRFNRVYRSYIMNPIKNIIYDQNNANIMANICYKLNKKAVDELVYSGIDLNTAILLIINRYSSTDERINIRRMVRAIQHLDPAIMTETVIINIFYNTFNEQLSNLFITIMTDKFDSFYNENEKYVYSTVSNAILAIVNTLAEEEIQDIIHEYITEINKMGIKGRFSLKSINSDDYKFIVSAVEYLENIGDKID